jgi:glutathione S-transferase
VTIASLSSFAGSRAPSRGAPPARDAVRARWYFGPRVLRLVTIPISHYCEKARWALDRSDLPYREERHVQLFHYVAALRAGGGATVPVLVVEGSRALSDSTDILGWLDERVPGSLYPDGGTAREEVLALEDRFDEVLGPATRRVVYFHLMDHDAALRYNDAGVPRIERAVLAASVGVARSLVKRFIRARLRVTSGAIPGDLAAIRGVFDQVAARVTGRRYLVGDGFTAADLTFASLAAPVLLPAEYGSPLPDRSGVPTPLRDLVDEMRRHPAGAYALRLYREERRAKARPHLG